MTCCKNMIQATHNNCSDRNLILEIHYNTLKQITTSISYKIKCLEDFEQFT